ncbi:MAG: hypothetical protein RLZZ338_3420 [Cyanobacteriota bacterium]
MWKGDLARQRHLARRDRVFFFPLIPKPDQIR